MPLPGRLTQRDRQGAHFAPRRLEPLPQIPRVRRRLCAMVHQRAAECTPTPDRFPPSPPTREEGGCFLPSAADCSRVRGEGSAVPGDERGVGLRNLSRNIIKRTRSQSRSQSIFGKSQPVQSSDRHTYDAEVVREYAAPAAWLRAHQTVLMRGS